MTPSAAVAHPRHDPSVQFDQMDTNHDGKISAKEHADAAARMFKDMDANADGQVTRAEMEAGHEKMMHDKTMMNDKTMMHEKMMPMPPGKR
jgi:Ca2+-binding EF-hand superfamily protein